MMTLTRRNRDLPGVRRSHGYTLIELMVSIAIALLLILGINQVFRISSDSAGAGQEFSTESRKDRTAQHTITNDLRDAVTTNFPFFLIKMQQQYAFRNAQDRVTAMDQGDASKDKAFTTGLYTGGKIPVAMVNWRSHRVDTLAFFARDLFYRQTSTMGGFTTGGSSSEAYIWYGHAQLPNNAEVTNLQNNASPSYNPNVYFDPGDPNAGNNNNLFASNWILARMQILMSRTLAANDRGYYITGSSPLYCPFAMGSKSAAPGDSAPLEAAHYDMARTDIQSYYEVMSAQAPPANNRNFDWYDSLIGFRYQVNPFVRKPITPMAAAKTAPVFVRGCTQFIVEYAGNFTTQDENFGTPNYGRVLAAAPSPDGKIDFIVDKSASVSDPTQWVRKIRWYGFPRDVNGDGKIDPFVDVVPLRDIVAPFGSGPYDFEHLNFPISSNYMTSLTSSYPQYTSRGNNNGPYYTCAWGPNTISPMPKLIRITIAIDDPNGHLNDAQTFEYIVPLQQ